MEMDQEHWINDSLYALQDFHQLSLLVWSHASEHCGPQHELQRPHVGKKKYCSSNEHGRISAAFVLLYGSRY